MTPYPDSAPTPAAHSSATPHAMYASTPGGIPYDDDQFMPIEDRQARFVFDDDWLVSFKEHRVHAMFHSHAAWQDGTFDDQIAIVQSVLEMPDYNNIPSTATVVWMKGQEQTGAVPIEYFKPIHPTRGAGYAVAMSGGFSGKTVQINGHDPSDKEMMCTLADPAEKALDGKTEIYHQEQLVTVAY